MKYLKLTSIATLLAIGVFFFASPVVHAEGFGASTWKTGSNLINNVSVVADVIEARATQMGGSGSSIVWQKDFLVTVQIQNLVDSPVLVNGLLFSLDFPSGTNVGIVSFESFSSDAWISNDGNLMFTIVPSNDFSYANGIVVPPSESIWVVGTITAQHVSDSNSSFSLSAVNIPTFTTARSDNYPYGATVNWSPLISAIDQYFNTQHVDNNNILTVLGSIKVDSSAAVTALSDILAAVTYSGSNPSISLPSGDFQESTYTGSGFTINVQRTFYSGVPLSYDFELNSTSDSPVLSGYYFCPFTVAVGIAADNALSVNSAQLILSSMFPSGYRVELTNFISDVFYPWTMDSRLILRYRQQVDSNKSLIPKGRSNTILYGRLYLPIGTARTLPTLDISGLNITASTYSGYVPRNEIEAWRDFLNAYSSSNRSDLDQQSNDIGSTSDAIHTQEQQFFNQNSQAIAQTGLSNYRFSSDQTGGISAVSNDFTAVFNALGGFNSVFIFSLTLALALRIIRHGPIVRSHKVNDVDPGGD